MSSESDEISERHGTKRLKTSKPSESEARYQPIGYDESVFKNELILQHIFKHLTSKQLKAIARVCRQWNDLCSKLASQRAKIEDFSLICGLTKWMRKRGPFSRLLLLESVPDYETLKDALLMNILNLTSVPSIALIFSSLKASKQENYSAFLQEEVLSSLPSTCSILSIGCAKTGVIGNSPDYKHAVETMNQFKFTPSISYLFLPDLVSSGTAQVIPIMGCKSEIREYLSEEQITQRNIKGVLMFYNYEPTDLPGLFPRELAGRQSRFALGGIMLDQIDLSSNVGRPGSEKRTMIRADFAALLFCGENVNCASLVINQSKEDEVKKRLVDFKGNLHFDPSEPGSELFGLLFACAGRSFQMFHKLNLESDLIKEQFPSVKLSGIFGLGEIGLNYHGDNRGNKFDLHGLLHFFTTVFVLIQIKRAR